MVYSSIHFFLKYVEHFSRVRRAIKQLPLGGQNGGGNGSMPQLGHKTAMWSATASRKERGRRRLLATTSSATALRDVGGGRPPWRCSNDRQWRLFILRWPFAQQSLFASPGEYLVSGGGGCFYQKHIQLKGLCERVCLQFARWSPLWPCSRGRRSPWIAPPGGTPSGRACLKIVLGR
jgi:hypothetical protein